MFTEEKSFISACARFGLVLDANMLVVYIVGHVAPEKIQQLDITSGYEYKDYEMIKYYVGCSLNKTIITTPYIVSEVVHLLNIEPKRQKRGKPLNKPEAFDKTLAVLTFSKEFTKTNVKEMVDKYGTGAILRFGIPDISLVEAVDNKAAFLSSDRPLCDEMTSKKLPALHYSRARVYYNKLSLNGILR